MVHRHRKQQAGLKYILTSYSFQKSQKTLAPNNKGQELNSYGTTQMMK